MPKFLVRVELRGTPDAPVYLKLHAFMGSKGFLMEAEGQQLPHATYFGGSEMGLDELSGKLSEEIRLETRFDAIVAVAQTEHVSINGRTGALSAADALGPYAANEEFLSAAWVSQPAGWGAFEKWSLSRSFER